MALSSTLVAALLAAPPTVRAAPEMTLNEIDVKGRNSRWIELLNSGTEAVFLGEFVLEVTSVDRRGVLVGVLPDVGVLPGEFFVVEFESPHGDGDGCDGGGRSSACVAFRDRSNCVDWIDADGGEVILRWWPQSVAVDGVRYPKVPSEGAFGRAADGGWCFLRTRTRGRPNSGCIATPDVVINEVSSAENLGADEDCRFAGCPDWVELYFAAADRGVPDAEVALTDFVLSDSGDNNEYRFDDVDQESARLSSSDPYAVVILSGERRREEWPSWAFHAPFGLRNTGDNLLLREIGATRRDYVAIPSLEAGRCLVRYPNGTGAWVISEECTLRAENMVRPGDLEPRPPRSVIIDRFPLEVHARREPGPDPEPLRVYARVSDRDDDLSHVVAVVEGVAEFPMTPGKLISCERGFDRGVFVGEIPRSFVDEFVFQITVRAFDRTDAMGESDPHDVFVQSPSWEDRADGTHHLRINEIAADVPNAPGDWVEIYNVSDRVVDIGGHYLTDDLFELAGRRIPRDVVIGPRGFLRVWCDGRTGLDQNGEPHVFFTLDACRDEVILLHKDEHHVIDAVTFHEEKAGWTLGRLPDVSLGEPDGPEYPEGYLALMQPTPGASNESGRAVTCVDLLNRGDEPSLLINEVLADNWRAAADRGGEYGDWVEIHNPTDRPVSLAGWSLRDRGVVSDPERVPWSLAGAADEMIQPGCFLVVWCDNDTACESRGRVEQACAGDPEAELHASFELDRLRDFVQLVDPCGNVVDCVSFGFGARDVAVGRYPDASGTTAFLKPTPGAPNLAAEFMAPPVSCADVAELFDVEGDPFPCLGLPPNPSSATFRRGDADGDCAVQLTDAIFTLQHLFRGGAAPPCADASDVNDDGEVNLADPVFLLGYLFAGGSAPPLPGPNTGGCDPTADALDTCRAVACRRGERP